MKFVSKFHRLISKKHYQHHSYHVKHNALKIWTCTAVLAVLCLIVYLYRINSSYCDERAIRNTLRTICNQYYRKQAAGPFCETMCAREIYLNQRPEDQTKGYYCPSRSLAHKNILLIGTTGDGHNYYLREAQHTVLSAENLAKGAGKNVELEPITWTGKDGRMHYPTEEEFLGMVNDTIFYHYNTTMPENKLKEMLNFKQNGSYQRLYNFMDNMWRLVHDNDFMMVQLGHQELFPEVLGYCGAYYATEYIQPFQASGHLERINGKEWKQRLQRAILIMDYVEEATETGVALCDIRYDQFGRSESSLKYLSAEHVHQNYFIDRLVSDMRPCWKDRHCNYKHCQSKCDTKLGRCSMPQMNNNYQVLCDTVLRGGRYSPGLLATSRASNRFRQLIDRCAEPTVGFDISLMRPRGPAKHLFDQVRAEIINMYDGLISH